MKIDIKTAIKNGLDLAIKKCDEIRDNVPLLEIDLDGGSTPINYPDSDELLTLTSELKQELRDIRVLFDGLVGNSLPEMIV